MKRFLYILPVVFILTTTKLFAQYEGTFGAGAHIKYAAGYSLAGGGVHLLYYPANRVRLASEYTHYLDLNSLDLGRASWTNKKLWTIDADVHYIVPLSWTISVYPVAGLNYMHYRFPYYNPDGTGFGDVKNRVGANIGLGIQYDIKYGVNLNLEVKRQLIKDFSQTSFMLGVGLWI